MAILQINKPNLSGILKGAALQASVAIGVKAFGRTLEGKTVKFDDFAMSEYLGAPTLTGLALSLGGVVLALDECVLTVHQEKNIISTPLQGWFNGSIKEYVSDSDYTIDVSAAITSSGDDNYPIGELYKLMDFLKTPELIDVQSDFLDLFGIKSVVVKSYDIVQETHSNRQLFDLVLLSDRPYEIKIIENDGIK